MTDDSSWHITGCGRMGTLAAWYLRAAGWQVTVIRADAPSTQHCRLVFPGSTQARTMSLAVRAPTACGPVRRLIVACKTPYTAARVAPIELAPDATIYRLQNGIGSLDGLLSGSQRLVEIVSASAVKSIDDNTLAVVAENTACFGGGEPPPIWPRLVDHWPRAEWQADIRHAQWRKLVVNAALNPLTALHDVPNGAIAERADLAREADALADEADALLTRLDPAWPGRSAARVAEIARATADNTSSMRADVQAGAITEIEHINGWLVARASEQDMPLPRHAEIAARIRARHPGHA